MSDAHGIFDIRTKAGTSFILELSDSGTDFITRKPGMSHATDGFTEPSRLPGDFTRLELVKRPLLAIDKAVSFHVLHDDGVKTCDTSPIVSITLL